MARRLRAARQSEGPPEASQAEAVNSAVCLAAAIRLDALTRWNGLTLSGKGASVALIVASSERSSAMVIRVVYAHAFTEVGEQVRPLGEQLRARFAQLAGFGSWQSGGDQQRGTVISITTWDTRAQAEGVGDAIADIIRQYEAAGVTFDKPEFYETTA
jgi:hypothetical protein